MEENKHPYLSLEHPIRLAHRGSCLLWPENTMTAFQGAINHGCHYIETDLHVTKDGTIVMFHDNTLDRITNATGPINEWHWNDLSKLDAAYHFKPEEDYPLRGKSINIPTLEETMDVFPNTRFNLDLKQPNIESTIADFINKYNYHDRVLITSFTGSRSRKCLKLLKHPTATSAGFRQALFFWALSRIKLRLPLQVNALQVPPCKGSLTVVDKKLINAAHALGIQVHAWVINDPDEMRRLLDLGVDGIVTDRIDYLNEEINTR
ncbi:MAG: glycerophosphodiester phosphodiesterase [bacterium]|nr:glycerophosphodiester phosphodiesterase [bacterium]